MTEPNPVPPADSDMAGRLAVNRTGRLTPAQRRTVLIAGLVALGILLCPAMLLLQLGYLVLSGLLPVVTVGGILFTTLGALFILLFAGMALVNVAAYLPDAFGGHPVRHVRGPLEIHMSAKERPELPFSYVVDRYSFAPFVAPPDLLLRPGAPYLVYYAAHSRMLLSLAALDAPDAAYWEPVSDDHPPKGST